MKNISILIFTLLLNGCATSVWEAKWGNDKPHISYVSLESGESQPDKLYVWNPNNNAAYIFQNGGSSVAACVASADVAKSKNIDSSFKIDVGEIVGKVDSAKVENTLKIIENITKLSEKKESASFLNVAMFHICMLSNSGRITPGQTNTLVTESIKAAASLSKQPADD
jgi:hypothetical protein